MIKAPVLNFTNPNSNYHICGFDDSIPHICYRIGPKGSMNQTLLRKYFSNHRAFKSDVHGRPKVIWVDNCTGHNMTLIVTYTKK